jgi:hypothetical protein
MAPTASLFSRMITQQPSWRREDAFDAVFALRIVVAAVLGVSFGVAGVEGFPYFLFFVAVNFFTANAWLSYQDINIEEMEAGTDGANDAMSPSLLTEGFGPSVPLFVVSF